MMLEKNATVVFEEFAPWWVPEPNGRGTWGVLSSCIFTLSLCVFTAIHLHVGPQGQTTAEYLLHKCKWVAIAIVAPEVTLYSAGKQWFSAARLSKKLNGLAGQCEPDLKKIESKPFRSGSDTPSRAVPFVSPKRPNFGMMYGHFAVMGGFVVDVKHLHDGFNRLTITPKGVAFLARHGHFLPVSEATISDKSKANTLAKGLVCLQVLWMISQSISRKVVGLPLTLLEVHTLIHAACALAMYGLWFQKPLDVRDPTVIDASEFPDVLAMMLMRNYGFGNRLLVKNGEAPVPIHSTEYTYQNGSESSYLQMYGSPKNKEQQRDPLAQGIEIAPVQPSNPWQASQQNAAYNFMPSITTHRNSIGCDYALTPPHGIPTICSIRSGQTLSCGIGPSLNVCPLRSSPGRGKTASGLEICLSTTDIRRWYLAAYAMEKSGEYLHKAQGSVNYLASRAPNIFFDRNGLQAGFYGFFSGWVSWSLVAAFSVCIFYGFIHTLAWNFEFPSPTERLLWRVACIDTMIGSISLLTVYSAVMYLHEHDVKTMISAFWSKEPGIISYVYRLGVLIGLLNLPLFVLSRFYIIIESFISLRHVPTGIYQTISWSDYIPHI